MSHDSQIILVLAIGILCLCLGFGYCRKTDAQARLFETEVELNERALKSNAVRIR